MQLTKLNRWRVSWRFLLGAFALLQAIQVAVYWESFKVMPAGDDFGSPMTDVLVADREGVLWFLWHSAHAAGFRPTASFLLTTVWRLGGPEYFFFGVRVLHFLCMAFLGLTTALWLRQMPVGRAGAIAAGVVLFFHPAMPQLLSSIDGLSLLPSGLVWFGAWCVLVNRNNFSRALTLGLLVFVVTILTKEIAVALAPLSAWVFLWFTRERRWKRAIIIAAAISLVTVFYIIARHYVLRSFQQETNLDRISIDPAQLAQNVAIFVAGIFFLGNSAWAYTHRSIETYAIVGGSIIASMLVLACGLWLRMKVDEEDPATDSNEEIVQAPGEWRGAKGWIVFLLVAGVIASFPASILNHVSEGYVTPVLIAVVLLSALAADGFVRWRAPAASWLKLTGGVLAIVAIVSSVITIRSKVKDLVSVGQRADVQLAKLLAQVPPDARNYKVLMLFLNSQMDWTQRYAVYRMQDATLLGIHALEWKRPGQGLELTGQVVNRVSDADTNGYDLVLLWDRPRQEFSRVR